MGAMPIVTVYLYNQFSPKGKYRRFAHQSLQSN